MDFIKKNKKIFIFNVVVLFLVYILIHCSLSHNVSNYIYFRTEEYDFKDLLSISITILTVFIGFMATIATVLMSMCDKRIMRLIGKFGKMNTVSNSIKKSIKYGLFCLILLGIMYTSVDEMVSNLGIMFINNYQNSNNNFLYLLMQCLDIIITYLRIILLYITLNLLFIFIDESRYLVFLVKKIMEETFKDSKDV